MAEFIGSYISLDCGEAKGVYQGQLTDCDTIANTLTISQPFCNGSPFPKATVTISALDIVDLKLVRSSNEANFMPEVNVLNGGQNAGQSEHKEPKLAPTATMKLPGGARADAGALASQMKDVHIGQRNGATKNARGTPTKGIRNSKIYKEEDGVFRRRSNSASEQYETVKADNSVHKKAFLTPNKQRDSRINGAGKTRLGKQFNDNFNGEFDFESNLALFDKQAVFEEIEASGIGEIMKAREASKQPAKYGCHENVIPSGPVQYRQIKVPGVPAGAEFVTDSGLVVPCVPYALRARLLAAAADAGLTVGRQTETVGRSAAEMVLQLCGGSVRLAPRNAHQRPSVVFLLGARGSAPALAACATRHLAAHQVTVTLYRPPQPRERRGDDAEIQSELRLIQDELRLLAGFTNVSVTDSVKDLPSHPVDVIVSAVDVHEAPSPGGRGCGAWHREVSAWAASSKAPVLKLDPPPGAARGAKLILAVALPLAHPPPDAQVYICDVGIPTAVFSQVGIEYQSPFEHKFYVSLHPYKPDHQ